MCVARVSLSVVTTVWLDFSIFSAAFWGFQWVCLLHAAQSPFHIDSDIVWVFGRRAIFDSQHRQPDPSWVCGRAIRASNWAAILAYFEWYSAVPCLRRWPIRPFLRVRSAALFEFEPMFVAVPSAVDQPFDRPPLLLPPLPLPLLLLAHLAAAYLAVGPVVGPPFVFKKMEGKNDDLFGDSIGISWFFSSRLSCTTYLKVGRSLWLWQLLFDGCNLNEWFEIATISLRLQVTAQFRQSRWWPIEQRSWWEVIVLFAYFNRSAAVH